MLPRRVRISWTDPQYAAPKFDSWVIQPDYATHLAPFGSKSIGFENSLQMPYTGPSTYAHDYRRGHLVDVLDIYYGSKTGKVMQQWTKSRVRRITRGRILVRFLGYPAYWDEWIDLTVDADRVRWVPRRRCHDCARWRAVLASPDSSLQHVRCDTCFATGCMFPVPSVRV